MVENFLNGCIKVCLPFLVILALVAYFSGDDGITQVFLVVLIANILALAL